MKILLVISINFIKLNNKKLNNLYKTSKKDLQNLTKHAIMAVRVLKIRKFI